MSASKVSSQKNSPVLSPDLSKTQQSALQIGDDEDGTRPDFIYGGPFIKVSKPSPFLTTSTPINIQLQGTFNKSYAYYSLKERLPVILTKIIDYCSREGRHIKSANKASDEDLRIFVQHVNRLKSNLMTNKSYDLFTVDTPEAKQWNEWIQSQSNTKYFTNVWLFTECYVYRKLKEGCERGKGLHSFDYFEEQKTKAFTNSLELMCIAAEKVVTMLPPSDKDKRKQDFIMLLKLCLWSNRSDLSLSAGSVIDLAGSIVDPIQMITDCKDKLLVDDSAKAADQVVAKAESIAKAIEGNTTFKSQCSCHRLATLAGLPQEKERPQLSDPGSPPAEAAADPPVVGDAPRVPCPAKMTIPQAVIFDIVCDNAAYELFCDLCLAHFLVSQKIVQKVRFHVKNMPWFVSDVTPKDFNYVIQSCIGANYSRTVEAASKPEPTDGSPPPPSPPSPDPPRVITSAPLQELGKQWQHYLDDGTFIVMSDPFWTYPHPYKDMRKYSPQLYRRLQFAAAAMFKGDLNYRKLLNDVNYPTTTSFDAALQGFNPTPIIAVRTVKAELICGLPKGKAEQLYKVDPKWMETGEYGVIQFSSKAEPLKMSDRPCEDYGNSCFGTVCPVHTDI